MIGPIQNQRRGCAPGRSLSIANMFSEGVPPELSSAPSVHIVDGSFTDIDIAGDYRHHGDVFNTRIAVYHPQSCFPPGFTDLVSMGATYDSQERDPAPRCHPGTRKEILEQVDEWVNTGADGTNILWLHGPAGAGKSAIAQTVAEKYAGRNQLAATFFFARTVACRNAIRHLFPTIAIQFALSSPDKRQKLDSILRNNPYIAERALGSIYLVASLCHDSVPSPFLVVIDGLDECQGHDDQCRILSQVSDLIRIHRLPLRFLIVSRPESHLCEAFEKPPLAKIAKKLSLYGDFLAHADVSMYLRSEFSRIYHSERHRNIMESVLSPWPSDHAIQRIASKSGGYFIYPSTVIGFVDEEYFSPPERLDQVLHYSSGISSTASGSTAESTPFAELDKLYSQILSVCPTSQIDFLKRILGHAVFHSRLRDIDHLAAFLRLPPGKVKLTLRGLRSLVSFDGSLDPLELVHASFSDFLLDEARAGVYHIDSAEWYSAAFCDGFSLGVNLLAEHGSQPPQYLIDIGENLSVLLHIWFSCSTRIDRLVASVHQRLEEGLWYSRFEDPGLSDEATLKVFALLLVILRPDSDYVFGQRFIDSAKVLLPHTPFSFLYSVQLLVTQREECTPATQELLMRLGTHCDSVLFNYLSKLADSPAKRNHLWVAHTIERLYKFSRWSFARLSRFLDFHASDFPLSLGWEDFSKYLCLREDPSRLLRDYLDNFLSDSGRSKIFHYDRGQWNTFVATLSLRCLRTW